MTAVLYCLVSILNILIYATVYPIKKAVLEITETFYFTHLKQIYNEIKQGSECIIQFLYKWPCKKFK